MHVRKDDMVEVIGGEDRGTRGKVLRVDRAAGMVVVEGVARVYKHVRRSQRNPQGGRLSKETPIPLCRVMLVCQSCNAAVRTGVRLFDDGSKARFCKKCGAQTGQISPPKTKRAKTKA
jgi:large subunit ribosomal protein L24